VGEWVSLHKDETKERMRVLIIITIIMLVRLQIWYGILGSKVNDDNEGFFLPPTLRKA